MAHDPARVWIYHITPISNLPAILAAGGLLSDAALVGKAHEVIGYGHIKERRLTQYRVPCCGDRFVGDFVPFYFCPRSPMLYTINKGNTGRPAGCQRDIVHLVSTVARALVLRRPWAVADGNAGAGHTSFYDNLEGLDTLDWSAIRATDWARRTHEKQAELLVADFFEWGAIGAIGCHNEAVRQQVETLLAGQAHQPKITVRTDWYY